MPIDLLDSFDALVGWLRLALGTLLPVITVVLAGTPGIKHRLFTDILSSWQLSDCIYLDVDGYFLS